MQKFIVSVCALLVVAIGATAAVSAEDLAAAVKERRDLMKKTVAPAAKLGGQMIKGDVPFDGAKAWRLLAILLDDHRMRAIARKATQDLMQRLK